MTTLEKYAIRCAVCWDVWRDADGWDCPEFLALVMAMRLLKKEIEYHVQEE